MPYKYIGRVTDFKGKTLWEILGNLKNYGVGRIVARNMFERYPEPSFMKIIKVETLPSPKVQTLDDLRKVRVWVERTFRGQKFPKLVKIESTSYKSDYKLIPKDEESIYCQIKKNEKLKIYPKTMEFPPLLKEVIRRENLKEGITEEPKLEIVYNKSKNKSYRVAEDGEKADIEIVSGLGKPISPSLYKGVSL